MKEIDLREKEQAIKEYLSGIAVSSIVDRHRIHRATFFRWLRRYRHGGSHGLCTKKTIVWNKFPARYIDKIIGIKEKIPSVTASQAIKSLKKTGINISVTGLWQIWQEYGYAGFVHDRISNASDWLSCIPLSEQTEGINRQALSLIRQEKTKQAARLINALPICRDREVMLKIPDRFLDIRKRVEKKVFEVGPLSPTVWLESVKSLQSELAAKKMHYSLLRLSATVCDALYLIKKLPAIIELTDSLKPYWVELRDPWLKFRIIMIRGLAFGQLLQTDKALECADKCKEIVNVFDDKPGLFAVAMNNLYGVIGMNRARGEWLKKALTKPAPEYVKYLSLWNCNFLATAGKYAILEKVIQKAESIKGGGPAYAMELSSAWLRAEIMLFHRGDFKSASAIAQDMLLRSKKNDLIDYIISSLHTIALCHAAVGDKSLAKKMVLQCIALATKHNIPGLATNLRARLGDFNLTRKSRGMEVVRLSDLCWRARTTMRSKDYWRAYDYAVNKERLGTLHNLLLLNPELVLNVLSKGHDPKLNRNFLSLPVFQTDPPVYTVALLGTPQIYKGEEKTKTVELAPKDACFLIHLAAARNRQLELSVLYRNFWPNSPDPANNLSHLLVRIRNALCLPQYMIGMRRNMLAWTFHVRTDFDEFEETIAQARGLENIGDWSFALTEYLRAFSLVKGAPFMKNFDNWSLDFRHRILTRIEDEAENFIRSCAERNNQRYARIIYARLTGSIPDFVRLRESCQSLIA